MRSWADLACFSGRAVLHFNMPTPRRNHRLLGLQPGQFSSENFHVQKLQESHPNDRGSPVKEKFIDTSTVLKKY